MHPGRHINVVNKSPATRCSPQQLTLTRSCLWMFTIINLVTNQITLNSYPGITSKCFEFGDHFPSVESGHDPEATSGNYLQFVIFNFKHGVPKLHQPCFQGKLQSRLDNRKHSFKNCERAQKKQTKPFQHFRRSALQY